MSKDIFTDENYQKFADLFESNEYANGKAIVERGYLNYDGKFEINYSSILSRLIQEAGRYCEHWASDLFIDWKFIDRDLENGSMKSRSDLFGFRDCGVDHNFFIFSKCSDAPLYDVNPYYYRSLWKLDIEVYEDEYYHSQKIKMSLYRTSLPSDSRLRFFFDKVKREAEDGISVPDKESVES